MTRTAVVEIKRIFLGGTLEGLTHVDQMSFASARSADEFVARVVGRRVMKPAGGGSPYEVVAARRLEA